MKPKNKFQRNIVETSMSLQPLTSKQIQWGLEHSINHVGHKSAKKIVTCTKCGHQWKSDTKRKHEKCDNTRGQKKEFQGLWVFHGDNSLQRLPSRKVCHGKMFVESRQTSRI